jgi:hypothetical protein
MNWVFVNGRRMDTAAAAMALGLTVLFMALVWWRDRSALSALQEQQRQGLLREMRSQEHEDGEALRKAMAELAADITHGRVVIEGSLEQMKRVADSLDRIPALVDGLEALVKSQVDKLDSLNRAVEVLEKSVVPSGSGGYQEYSEDEMPDDVKDELEVKRLVRAGIPVDQARARVREASLYRGVARGR